MSIEDIVLEHFNELPQTRIISSTKSCPRHAVFHYFLLEDRKQYAANNTKHSKHLIKLLKGRKVLESSLSTIWENTVGCADQYRCESALYLMPVLSQCYLVINDRGISKTGHVKELVNGLNAIEKRYINQLMSNVQLTG